MQRVLMLLICLVLQGQAKALAETGASGTDLTRSRLELQFAGGLLSAEIENVPLSSVLAELGRRTGTAVRFIEPAAAALTVWASFKNVPLEKATRLIMRDASYIYYASPTQHTVYVLSSAASRLAPSAGGGSFTLSAAAGSINEGAEAIANDIQQATAQLNSGDTNARVMAAGQLAGVQDHSAVQALMSTAISADDAVEVRVSAASALAQSALSAPAQETTALAAIRQLRNDRNPHVRAVAEQTLHDIEQQRAEIARM